MSKEFLPTILKQKAKEVEELEMESLQPLRETYKLYDYLKNNAKKLQVIAEVKKLVLALVTLILMSTLSNKLKLTKTAVRQ